MLNQFRMYEVIVDMDGGESVHGVMHRLLEEIDARYVIVNEQGPNGNRDSEILVIGTPDELAKFEHRYDTGYPARVQVFGAQTAK